MSVKKCISDKRVGDEWEMDKCIDIKNICILQEINSIEEGILTATDLLTKNGYTKKCYETAVKTNFEKFGRDFAISPYVILPHARPEQGVIQSGVSIVLLKKPYFYKTSNIAVRLIIVLAANSSKDHLEYLKFFVEILSDERKMEKILNADCEKEILACMKKKEGDMDGK